MKKLRIGLMIIAVIALFAVLSSCQKAESAYDIAVRNGYTGSETEWLASLNGTDGQNGLNGQNGENGKDGADGVGVKSFKIDEKGYLIVTLTNGKTVNAGYVGLVTPDASTDAPKLNTDKLDMAVGDLYILTSDRASTTFSSSNENIVQVSSDGLMLAVGEGSATITATSNDGKKATCTVNSFAYTYERISGGVKLTGYNGQLTEIVLPNSIMGEAVKAIGNSVFAGTSITAVTLPASVVTVGEDAFNGCAALASVKLGEGITSIGRSAFRNCKSLVSIVIPDQVVSVGEYAFADCEKLAEVTVGGDRDYGENVFVNTPWYEANKDPEPPLNVFIDVNETVWVYPTDDFGNHLADQFSNYYATASRDSVLGSIKDGTELTRTGLLYEDAELNGWSRLTYHGQTIYMRNSQITNVDQSVTVPDPPTPPAPPVSDDIYFYDPSSVPAGMVGVIPQDLSNSDKGVNYISDKSDTIDPDLAQIMAIDVSSTVTAGEPLVLIYHTHGTESYIDTGLAWYNPNEISNRSTDPTKNVISVGALLAEKLNELGIPTLHCDIMHDAESYSAAYSKSAETIQKFLTQYPSIKYVIDLHRDAVSKTTGETVRAVAEVNGAATAQVMCVVGSSAGIAGDEHWKGNLALAQKLRAALSESYPKLCRPTYFKDSTHNYNQQLAPYSLLLEMGMLGNSLDEAKSTAELIAPALAKVIKGE